MSGKLKSNGDLATVKDSQEIIYKSGEYCITSNVQSILEHSYFDLGENEAVAYMCEPCSSEVSKKAKTKESKRIFHFSLSVPDSKYCLIF